MSPMFAEDICRIDRSFDVIEDNHLGWDGFMKTVKGKHGVMLVSLGMNPGPTVHNRFVVTEHVACSNYRRLRERGQ